MTLAQLLHRQRQLFYRGDHGRWKRLYEELNTLMALGFELEELEIVERKASNGADVEEFVAVGKVEAKT